MTEERLIRVLIADDEQHILSIVSFALRHSGMFEPLLATDGEMALRMAAEESPDLIVLDVDMPSMDGLAACRALRSADATRSVPILLLTAMSQRTDIEAGLIAGADDYVTKPFSPDELVTRLLELHADASKGRGDA